MNKRYKPLIKSVLWGQVHIIQFTFENVFVYSISDLTTFNLIET